MSKPKPKYNSGVTFKPDRKEEFEIGAVEEFAKRLSTLSYDPIELSDKILEFGIILTGIQLYDYQKEFVFRVIHSVVAFEGEDITFLNSRQSGKTESLAVLIDSLIVILPILAKFFPELDQYKDGIKIGLFAPQSDQLDTTYSRAMLRLGSDQASLIMSDPDIDTHLTSTARISLTNGSYVHGQVISKNSKIESKTYDLVLIDEAQDTDSYIVTKSVEPMLTATFGTLVKTGSTGTTKNHFWQDIQNNIRKSRKVTNKRLVFHFENNYKKVIADRKKQFDIDGKLYHLNYEKDVLKKKQKWGEDSDAFRLGYALLWALDTGMFITDKDWETMLNRKKGFPKKLEKDWVIVAGLDIAKSIYSTVLTVAKVERIPGEEFDAPLKEIIGWLEIHGEDYETQHHMIVDACIEYGVQVLFADYTGVGKPVVDRLMYSLSEYTNIVPYTFSTPSKSEGWLSLHNDIKNRRIVVPANKTVQETSEFKHFEEQLKSLQKWYQGSYMVCEKPSDDPDAKDDFCDSLFLMSLAGNFYIPEVEDIDDDDVNPLLETLSPFNMALRNAASW